MKLDSYRAKSGEISQMIGARLKTIEKMLKKVKKGNDLAPNSLETVSKISARDFFKVFLRPWGRRPWETFFGLFLDFGPRAPERLPQLVRGFPRPDF